ncbi:MAG: alpha/beta hydrolase [Opitutaceae bacterium]|nr:alpha/beta hydrolase [Opitutaceae bacterium]
MKQIPPSRSAHHGTKFSATVGSLFALAVAMAGPVVSHAQAPADRNVVYGMYSGLALLLDVYRPEKPNGFGVIHVKGSGWQAGGPGYGAPQLKRGAGGSAEVSALVEAGYTVFSVNHRGSAHFPYPAAVEDVQRAVRFIRHNAREYGIDAGRIGAIGGSSGGHLVSMLGVLDGAGDAGSSDPVEQESAKIQTVVARATPADLRLMPQVPQVVSFVGMPMDESPASPANRRYLEVSPFTYVSPDDPPFLLVHGEADATVPFTQSEFFVHVLREAGVEVKLVRIAGGTHGPTFGDPERATLYGRESVQWFNSHLPHARPAGRPVPVAREAASEAGDAPLDRRKASEIRQKAASGQTLTPEEKAYLDRFMAARGGAKGKGSKQ